MILLSFSRLIDCMHERQPKVRGSVVRIWRRPRSQKLSQGHAIGMFEIIQH